MLKEILALALTVFPGWAMLMLNLRDRLRRRKHKRSDGRREEL